MFWPHAKTPVVFNRHRIQKAENRRQNSEDRKIWHLTFQVWFVPRIINPPLSKDYKNCAHRKTKIRRCLTSQAQASLMLSIPN